jgi:hypothetical protein
MAALGRWPTGVEDLLVAERSHYRGRFTLLSEEDVCLLVDLRYERMILRQDPGAGAPRPEAASLLRR